MLRLDPESPAVTGAVRLLDNSGFQAAVARLRADYTDLLITEDPAKPDFGERARFLSLKLRVLDDVVTELERVASKQP